MKLTALIALAAAREIKDTRVPNKPNVPNRSHTEANKEISECGGSITSSDTVITSPGFDDPGYYNNNLNCVWTVDIPGATAITVIPEHFEIEPQDTCSYDALTIVDGAGNANSFCGTHTDFGTPPTDDDDYSYYYSSSSSYSSYSGSYYSSSSSSSSGYSSSSSSGSGYSGSSSSSGSYSSSAGSSSGRKRRSDSDDKPDNAPRSHLDDNPMWSNFLTTNGARIEFTTDYAVTMKGFKLRIVSGVDLPEDSCVQIQDGSGVVTSPNFPSEYDSDNLCHYALWAEEGKNIKIRFTHFDVEPCSFCGRDALVIDRTRYCGSDFSYTFAPQQEIIIQSDRTVIDFFTDGSVTHSGFRFEWESVDTLEEPAVFWAHMQEFYELTKAQMENGEYDRPWRVPYFKRMFNRIVSRGRIEDYSQLEGECDWRGQQPSYEKVFIEYFDEDQNRCMNLIRMAEMGLQYIDSYVCMEGHSKPKSTLKRWKMWMNKIRDLGRNICGLDVWQKGPVSLPAGLTCPTPENPFQRSANRIVGGQDVDRATTWPWMVVVGRGSYPGLNGCGGSIISKNPSGQSDWILTAAHSCCENSSSIKVLIGSQNREDKSPGEFSVRSTRVINHPNFSGWGSLGASWGTGHDICLLEVPNLTDSQSPDCDNCWSPVCLPSEHAEPGRLCYVAGWGTTSFDGGFSSELKDVGVNIFSREHCIATNHRPEQIKETEFCAGVPDMNLDGFTDGGKGSCRGDSGGPLVCQEGSTAVQYGVYSWGWGCGEQNRPGVYARLGGPVTDWIYATMNENKE